MIALIESSITIFNKYWPSFLYGLQYTLLISFVGTGVGLIIGLLIGGFRAIKIENSDSLIQRVSKKYSLYYHQFILKFLEVLQ